MEANKEHTQYTEDELRNIFTFINLLRAIHDRLVSEGIDVEQCWHDWQNRSG